MRIEISKDRYSLTLISHHYKLINLLCADYVRIYNEGRENFSSDFEIEDNNGVKIGKVTHDFAQGFIEFIPYKN